MEVTEDSIVRGVLKRVTYRNPTNGYSVMVVSVPELKEAVTVVGACPEVHAGSHIIARGHFIDHPKFGRQLHASSITESVPTSSEGLSRFLASGIVKGIGPVTAERIVETFGEDALEVIHNDPRRLAKVKGLSRDKADQIVSALTDHREMQQVLRFLIEHEISPKLADRIYSKYKTEAIDILNRNPYQLARDIRGVGFLTADTIAEKLGIESDSPVRLEAGLLYGLEKSADDGNCYLDEQTLFGLTAKLLGLAAPEKLENAYERLKKEKPCPIAIRGTRVYLKATEIEERYVASFASARVTSFDAPRIDESLVIQATKTAEKRMGLTFSVEQKEAVNLSVRNPLLLVTGGPGCGKTTIIRAICDVYSFAQKRVLLAAPTGRAAQRMSQVCNMPASTIHRLLQFDPFTGQFAYGGSVDVYKGKVRDTKLFLEADCVIIDEASMIDVSLAQCLLSAIGPSTVLVLVGDKDQLPSVGPGKVFADLLAVKDISKISLTQLYRREAGSDISVAAHAVNAGLMPDFPETDKTETSDLYFIPRKTPDGTAELVEELISERIPKRFGFSQEEVLVITPSNRGSLGTIALNLRLQERLNPKRQESQTFQFENYEFRIGDRVCQRVNNYQLHPSGVFNGDTGIIISIDSKEQKLQVDLWDGRRVDYDRNTAHQLSLAYAITVHRAQGLEAPCVVMALDESHYTLLERQLLYTGMTRAKKLLIVAGSKRALGMAIKRAGLQKRLTSLTERIEEHLIPKG